MYAIVCLWVCTGLFSQSEENLTFTLSKNNTNLDCGIQIREELVYLSSSQSEVASLPATTWAKGLLPVTTHRYAILRFHIQLTTPALVDNPNSAVLKLKVDATGAFTPMGEQQLVLRRNKQYKGTIDVGIQSTGGTGQVTISMVDLEGHAFREAKKSYRHDVHVQGKIVAATQMATQSVQEQVEAVRENAFYHANFKHLLQAQYNDVGNVDGARILLRNCRSLIDQCYSSRNTVTFTTDQAINFYRVFGQPELYGHSEMKSYFDNAQRVMREAEEAYVQSNSGAASILDLENRAKEYERLFCVAKYPCPSKGIYKARIEQYINEWKGAGTGARDFCSKWADIALSNYYNTHPTLDIFQQAKNSCEANSCQGIKSRYARVNSIDVLSSMLGICKSKSCDQAVCAAIQQRITLLDCQEKLEQAQRETVIAERRSILLSMISNDAQSCPEIANKAKALLGEIELLVIRSFDDAVSQTDPQTGGRVLEFTVYFESGRGISLLSVDGAPDFDTSAVQLQWIKTDRSLLVRLKDREKPYDLVFKSAINDEAPLQLSKHKFEASAKIEGDNIIVSIKNGTPPYFIRFYNAGGSFTVKVNAPSDTISVDELAQSYAGNYQFIATDNNGKQGWNDPVGITLKRGFHWQLWSILLLPVLLMSGFIIYRNTYHTES